ncbi:MAG: dockerin type I domain-containing protein [Planctomycetota bacterium]
MTDRTPDLDRELNELEARLGGQLREELATRGTEVPADLDRAVRKMIAGRGAEVRRSLSRRGRSRPMWAAAAAAAAAFVAGAGIWTTLALRSRAARGDLDRSGSVDIVDAYLLARRLESGEERPPEWDVNRDGRVDGADVDDLARRAVSLGGEDS